MHTYMYMYMYIHIYIHTHIHMYIYLTLTHTHTYIYTYIYIHKYIQIYIYIRIRIRIRLYIRVLKCIILTLIKLPQENKNGVCFSSCILLGGWGGDDIQGVCENAQAREGRGRRFFFLHIFRLDGDSVFNLRRDTGA